MMTGAHYLDSLRALSPRVFYKGVRLEAPYDHPALFSMSIAVMGSRPHPVPWKPNMR